MLYMYFSIFGRFHHVAPFQKFNFAKNEPLHNWCLRILKVTYESLHLLEASDNQSYLSNRYRRTNVNNN